MKLRNADHPFDWWRFIRHVAGVSYGDTCHPDWIPFGPQPIHFWVTCGTHAKVPCHHRWHQHVMSSLGLCPLGVSNVSTRKSAEVVKSCRPSDMEQRKVDCPFGWWCVLCHMEGVLYRDTCHMISSLFGPQHFHFWVTHGTHTMGPCHHRWHQHVMSYPELWPPGMSNSSEGRSNEVMWVVYLRKSKISRDHQIHGGDLKAQIKLHGC